MPSRIPPSQIGENSGFALNHPGNLGSSLARVTPPWRARWAAALL